MSIGSSEVAQQSDGARARCEPSCAWHRVLAEPPGSLRDELTRVAELVADIATCAAMSYDPETRGERVAA